MNEDKSVCYITYAVPLSMMPQIPLPFAPRLPCEETHIQPLPPQEGLYPEGFMPDWFLRGSFPEDDFDD